MKTVKVLCVSQDGTWTDVEVTADLPLSLTVSRLVAPNPTPEQMEIYRQANIHSGGEVQHTFGLWQIIREGHYRAIYRDWS
jgi:hypothetical protein